MTPDLINGLFEFAGALAIFANVVRLVRDRKVMGVHWASTLFFTAWGFWNLFYYPHLGQWFSLAGGMCIVLVNAVWLVLVAAYRRRPA